MSRGAIVIEERVRVPADVFELERFRDWAHSSSFPDRGRISFIGGEIEVDMSPEEIETHNKVKTQLLADLVRFVQSHDLGELLSDRAFLVNEAAELATEPDIMFSSWDGLRSGRVRYGERVRGSERYVEVNGSPDLIVEVVSQNSVRKDTVLLRERYFRAGVAEYWIVDARGDGVELTLLARPASGAADGTAGEYREVAPDADDFRASPVLGRAFRIVRDVNPVGGAAYRLLDR